MTQLTGLHDWEQDRTWGGRVMLTGGPLGSLLLKPELVDKIPVGTEFGVGMVKSRRDDVACVVAVYHRTTRTQANFARLTDLDGCEVKWDEREMGLDNFIAFLPNDNR